MYHVLIVDDEQPSIRFVRSVIDQFSTGFHVIGTASSGNIAFEFLQKHKVDLLITDISMHGMNGIELAQLARKLQPKIHIIVISGYGEFEYAQGAIHAGVDDYLLKPINIAKLTAILASIHHKLEIENADLNASVLPALACEPTYNKELVHQLYGQKNYRFAYIRWNNLDVQLPKTLGATSLLISEDEHFQILRGRDSNERILIAEDNGVDEFLSHLSVYMARQNGLPTWTAIYTMPFQPIEALPSFILSAINMLYQKTVIGRHQILQLSGNLSSERIRLPDAELKQLSHFLSFGKTRMIKEYFQQLSDVWERAKTPQRQVWHMGRQIIHQVAAVLPSVNNHLEEHLSEFNQLLLHAVSYSALMENLYTMLIDTGTTRNQKMSTQELYEFAKEYICTNYAQPLSMQSVCDEIGISQTYLSRLFRKYSDTTFNVFLTQCRMEAAMKLLREKPNLLLRDVAVCVGYDDSSYFTKVFRQYTGKTPSQWAAGE